VHQGDIEAPVHAGHQEPQASSRHLVQDVDGRVAQHLLRVVPVVEHAADTAVDDVSEAAVQGADCRRRQGRGRGLQVPLAQCQ
jgi:hypothetical protein